MVERLNNTLCQMLSHLVADNQTNWDELLLHAIAAHNNIVSRGTGLAPNEVHIGPYPRLPMTIQEGRGARGHQGLRRDQLDFLQLSWYRPGFIRLDTRRLNKVNTSLFHSENDRRRKEGEQERRRSAELSNTKETLGVPTSLNTFPNNRSCTVLDKPTVTK